MFAIVGVIVLTLMSIRGESTFASEEEISGNTTARHHNEASICDHSKITVMLAVVVCSLLLLMLAVFTLYFKKQTKVYQTNAKDKARKYDVFISFSHKDEKFVMNELLDKLEGPPHHLKVCVNTRDWIVGKLIPDAIIESIENSRRTIFVLTPDFLDSIWCTLELKIAHYFTFKDPKIGPIALIYEDIGHSEKTDEVLEDYFQTGTCVKWGEPQFWKKLYNALPHSSEQSSKKNLN